MKLHGFASSTASFRVRIALNLKQIDYVAISEIEDPNGPALRNHFGIGASGVVPMLEDEGDTLLHSLAIIEYLDETSPYPPFLPGHPGDRARVRGLAQIVTSDLHPLVTPRVSAYLTQTLGHDETAERDWLGHWMTEAFFALEELLVSDDRTGHFCHGDEVGLADICLVPEALSALDYGIDLTPYPTIRCIVANCQELPAFKKAKIAL